MLGVIFLVSALLVLGFGALVMYSEARHRVTFTGIAESGRMEEISTSIRTEVLQFWPHSDDRTCVILQIRDSRDTCGKRYYRTVAFESCESFSAKMIKAGYEGIPFKHSVVAMNQGSNNV